MSTEADHEADREDKMDEAQGGRLARVEKPRLSLDAYFLKEVQQRESEHANKVRGGESL